MKHLKLYEEYTDSTIDTGETQSTGKTSKTTTGQSNVIEVVFYENKEQTREIKRGWINLNDWDKKIKNTKKIEDSVFVGFSFCVEEGMLFPNKDAAKSLKGGETISWPFYSFKPNQDNPVVYNHRFITEVNGKIEGVYSSKLSDLLEKRLLLVKPGIKLYPPDDRRTWED